LLSPPAQFSAGEDIPHSSAPSYVTLPRQQGRQLGHQGRGGRSCPGRPLQPRGSGQHVDWSSFIDNSVRGKAVDNPTSSPNSSMSSSSSSSSSSNPRVPAYDGVGVRTSATGGVSGGAAGALPGPRSAGVHFNPRCPTIPEEPAAVRSASSPHLSSANRDSSGSEITHDDNLSSYCEPFGKAVPAPPRRQRDSLVSVDSDMSGILSSSSAGVCPLHKPPAGDVRGPPQPPQKQLKGILKGGAMNRPQSPSSSTSSSSSRPAPPPGILKQRKPPQPPSPLSPPTSPTSSQAAAPSSNGPSSTTSAPRAPSDPSA